MMDRLLRAMGEASLSAGVMILAVTVLRLWFQDHTPRKAFCLLWDMVLVRLLLFGALPSPVSIRQWLPQITARPAAAIDGVLQNDVLTAQAGGIIYLTEDFAQTGPGTAAPPPLNWVAVLAVVWLTAALLLALGFLWGHLRSRRVYAASLPVRDPYILDWLASHPLRRPVQARVSDRITAPLTYGVVYPVILLPKSMVEDRGDRHCAFGPMTGPAVSQSDTACVLAHEHTHIRRFDALRKVFLAAALCFHWWNPLVWAMYVLANRDIELACDEAVLRDGADREQYALALLNLEERRGGWRASGSHFSGQALEERIKAIMKRKHISVTALVAVLVVMCITTTVFASAAPEGRETTQTNDQNPPQTGYLYDHLQLVEDSGISILSKGGEDGEKFYSDDEGKTWMSEESYQAKYGDWGDNWQVEWWTYEDYKAWLEEEKEVLPTIIGDRGYTGSKGWFTWDQKMVDETIAMYEGILEEIKNGALYSKTIIDKNGNELEDVALGSDGPVIASTYEAGSQDVIISTYDLGDHTAVAPKSVDEAALLTELKAFGIGGNANLMTYNGELVRYFVDGTSTGDNGYAIAYVYRNDNGTIDLHTLRSVVYNPDGSYDPMGDLIGLAVKGDKNYNQELVDCATFDHGPQVTTADVPVYDQNVAGKAEATAMEDGSTGRGKTFEEIFAQYEQYGLTYHPRNGGMGSMIYNNQPVRSFADLKPDGGAFSYSDPYAEDGLTVYTVYDENGNIIYLESNPMPVKSYNQEKQELGFDHTDPVNGKISNAFGRGASRLHRGVDLAAEKGTDVVAFADGVVSKVGFDADQGNYVILAHANGYTTHYGHCASVTVAEGDSVAMGQKIAEVGSSGMATGSVLHFELRCEETHEEYYVLDPALYLDSVN